MFLADMTLYVNMKVLRINLTSKYLQVVFGCVFKLSDRLTKYYLTVRKYVADYSDVADFVDR